MPLLAWTVQMREGKLLLLTITPKCEGTLKSDDIVGANGLVKKFRPMAKLVSLEYTEFCGTYARVS